jgi:signal transduction histidine kinase
MSRRAWKLSPASAILAVLAAFALSTQLLFQRSLYVHWSRLEIVTAWIRQFADLVIVVAAILLALALAGRIPAGRLSFRGLLFATALLVGACLGEWLVLWLQWGAWPTADFAAVLPRALRWLPIGAVSVAILVFRQRSTAMAEQLHAAEVKRLQLEQQCLAIQVQTLQSQIEPHFLFNTLATIRRLYQTDRARGHSTLAGFVHYLQSALPGMRAQETTLGRELDLITAYVDVLRVRMGSRLNFAVDVAPALRSYRIPPLSLATLVENAVKHGLSSLPEGGKLSIDARLDGGRLVVRVADTGAGFTAPSGTGMGLANLRVRLRALYGDAGVLALSLTGQRGVTATLQVPATRADDAGSHDDA